jgi:hypothetical protein
LLHFCQYPKYYVFKFTIAKIKWQNTVAHAQYWDLKKFILLCNYLCVILPFDCFCLKIKLLQNKELWSCQS